MKKSEQDEAGGRAASAEMERINERQPNNLINPSVAEVAEFFHLVSHSKSTQSTLPQATAHLLVLFNVIQYTLSINGAPSPSHRTTLSTDVP